MGIVFRAHDTHLDRDIALKLLPEAMVEDAAARSRLLREARTASQLSHPHICHVYEAGEADGYVYIAMEFLDGRALSESIPVGGLPLESILRIGSQIAEALAHAHGKGVIHRDLKANNVIVTADGRAAVLDFGLAKRELSGQRGLAEPRSMTPTATGVIMGTPAYWSPEVLRGEPATAQSDIWALGVVLYTMASGELPFSGRSVAEVCGAILKDAPAPLEEVHPGLRAVIQRCLAKEPTQRYKLATEVNAALQALQPGSTASSRRVPRGGNRWPLVAAGIGAAALAVFLLTDVVRRGHPIGAGTPGGGIHSLAVLPLSNLSGDPRQEYFADGLTDELIADLASIPSFTVISRTSAMRYKGTGKAVPEIARELGVDGIVEGSVLRSDDHVRIKVQLIDAARDRHVWTQTYDRDLRDILAMQTEVGHDIAERLHVALAPRGAAAPVASPRPVDPEAYESYLRGRYFWNKRTPDALLQARDNFERAIRKDSTYAVAYAGLADTYVLMSVYAGSPTQESYPSARAAALHALKIDERLAEAHASLGRVKLFYDWDWAGAESEFKRAIQLKPGLSTAHHWYSIYLRDVGRVQEAIAEASRALELDPVSLIINANLGDTYFYAGRFDEAVSQHRKTLLLDPEFAPAHLYLGRALEQKGLFSEAVAEIQRARSLMGNGPYALGDLAHAYALSGRRKDATGLLEDLQRRSKAGARLDVDLALAHLGLGDKDGAIQDLGEAYKQRSGLNDLKVDPRFAPLRTDPRFQDLLVRLGLSG